MGMKVDIKKLSPVKTDDRKNLGLRSGDTVRVHQKIQEKGKIRIQVFEGLVIATKHGTEIGGTFTVRTTLSGIGVEKTFPLYSPMIEKIEIIRRSKVRRAKLYYIRDKASREIKKSLRNMVNVALSTDNSRDEAPIEVAATPEPAEATAE
jgi:large subunit ribosomal protein L19